MKPLHIAAAGTLESSDAMVTIEPRDGEENTLSIESSVLSQYGKQIRRVIQDTLSQLHVQGAAVVVVDKGALDTTLRARVACAVYRSIDQTDSIPWGGGF